MIQILLLMLLIVMMVNGIYKAIRRILYKNRIIHLLEGIRKKEDFLYIGYQDFLLVVTEIFRRQGNTASITSKCGTEGSGLLLNDLQFVDVWKRGLSHLVEVETAMKLVRCMHTNGIYRGILITLGDFKQNTRNFCRTNVIQCINGDQLLAMCKEVQQPKGALQWGG